jgi:organic hydroperoxide reductase OsmC/OhrA
MSTHTASVHWARTTPDFLYDTYDRSHAVHYGCGRSAEGSAAPDYLGDPTRLNPEEALVGALSSCHMLTFLAICARKRLIVDSYACEATGHLDKNDEGRLAITRIDLHPVVVFAPGLDVTADALAKLHEAAHHNCFIAQTIRSEVRVT